MTDPVSIRAVGVAPDDIAQAKGRVAVFVGDDGKLDQLARRVNRLTKGALERLVESERFEKLKTADSVTLEYPAGMAATAVQVVKLGRKPSVLDARKAGAAIGKVASAEDLLVLAGNLGNPTAVASGIALRKYDFTTHKTKNGEVKTVDVTMMLSKPDEAEAGIKDALDSARAVFFTRDLTNEPSNVLTTTEFADRLAKMSDLGLEVEVLEESDLEELGMRTLLAVGQGSESPSKVVVMRWNGGSDDAPLALIGKGVVFDTGGISIKPALNMEDMTMDMGGAGVVAGVMRGLALRKAKANVVGIVGLVENMPDGKAQRPGDVVRSMKGDTVEVINTDAEGRLVLADLLWYAQERFKPSGMVDLATLTGAVIIALGHEKAGVFGNDDDFADTFLKAAKSEGEGAWHLPLDPAYDEALKSRVADIKNTGGRAAGSITAAQFLQNFVKSDTPWIHLDIAGVASVGSETTYAPKGATGWGVRALDRMIRDKFEN